MVTITLDVRNTTVTVRCRAVEPELLNASSRNASSPRSERVRGWSPVGEAETEEEAEVEPEADVEDEVEEVAEDEGVAEAELEGVAESDADPAPAPDADAESDPDAESDAVALAVGSGRSAAVCFVAKIVCAWLSSLTAFS
jgi:hypothetical protein